MGDMSVYTTDDYPRVGCTVTIDVQADGYVIAIHAPNGAPMESYGAKTPAQVGRMLKAWCEGRAPRLHGPGD